MARLLSCPSPDELRRVLREDTAGGADEDDLSAHLGECSRCQALLASEGSFPDLQRRLEDRRQALASGFRVREDVLQAVSAPFVGPEAPTPLPERPVVVGLGARERPLGKYRLLECLGRGGMGEVWRASDPDLHREVAVKVLRPELADDANFRERFLREARTLAQLQHDHVVAVHDVGVGEGMLFLVMDLLQGENLDARLKREGPLPLDDLLRIGREAALGLAAVHERGLVHRDVKPANLFIQTSGRVRLVDFGLARPVEKEGRLTQGGAAIGTPYYMAPEQALVGEVDARADLFSLGCTLYQCATGQLPFSGAHFWAVCGAGSLSPSTPATGLRPGLPPALTDLVRRLLASDPADRPASAREVGVSNCWPVLEA